MEKLMILNNIIIAITFLAILWYAWETRGMRKEMINQANVMLEQTEISIMPILHIDEEIIDDNRYVFFLKNFGNFPAFNVSIEDLEIEATFKTISPKVVKFIFHEFGIVPPGEKIPVVYDIKNAKGGMGKESREFYEPHLFEGYATYDFEVPITYENILGHKYQATLKWGKSGANMGKPRRVG